MTIQMTNAERLRKKILDVRWFVVRHPDGWSIQTSPDGGAPLVVLPFEGQPVEVADAIVEAHNVRVSLREQLQNEREAGLSAYEACGLRGAYWHVVETLGRRDEELEHARNAGPPGLWVCPRCAFVCMRSNLNARDGSITANLDDPEPCPNDGEMLRRVTWREHAQDMAARATEQMAHAERVQAQLDRVTAEWEKAQAKGRAFDRVRDALAEFGDTEHIGGILSELLGTWEHEYPEDATLGQLIDALAFHGCVTGDCPDGHTTRECSAALVAAINDFAADARSKLRAALDTRESPQAKLDALLAQPTPPEWRMDAYYFGFFGTGILAVDRILSAVACAGKAYHHTDSWMNDCEPYPHLRGGSPVEWIRNAAHDLAALLRRCCDHDVDGNCDRHPTKEPDRG